MTVADALGIPYNVLEWLSADRGKTPEAAAFLDMLSLRIGTPTETRVPRQDVIHACRREERNERLRSLLIKVSYMRHADGCPGVAGGLGCNTVCVVQRSRDLLADFFPEEGEEG